MRLVLSKTTLRSLCTTVTSSELVFDKELVSNRNKELVNNNKPLLANTNRVCLPTVSLPHGLNESLNKLLSVYPKKSLIRDSLAITQYLMSRQPPTDYRMKEHKLSSKETRSNSLPLRYGRRECVAYAASRTQSIYGTTLRVFKEIASIDSAFQPETMLDFGSGLATAVWAAHTVWGNSLYEYQTIDSSPDMGQLAQALRTGGDGWISDMHSSNTDEAIRGVYFKQYLPVSNKVTYDLVVSAYSLSELPTISIWKQTLASLWKKTNQYLVLIEVGTPGGFNIISEAKDFILQSNESLKGHVIAPCPHDHHCPLADQQSKCQFGQRVQLSLSQANLRSAGVYSEQFSYIVFKKGPCKETNSTATSRLLLPVKKRSRHVICRLCCPNGTTCQVIFTKAKHKELYSEVRKSQWGDTVNVPIAMYEKKSEFNDEQDTE